MKTELFALSVAVANIFVLGGSNLLRCTSEAMKGNVSTPVQKDSIFRILDDTKIKAPDFVPPSTTGKKNCEATASFECFQCDCAFVFLDYAFHNRKTQSNSA